MPLSEEVVADYQTTRLSLKAHPMAFLRADLAARGFVRASDLRERKFRSMVQVAGVVLIRQRPGSAKGVTFITLEDETGVINLVVWPDLKEKLRKVVMGARLMEVRGRVEYDDEVIHVIAAHMTDATHRLHALSDDLLDAPRARADDGLLRHRPDSGTHRGGIRRRPDGRLRAGLASGRCRTAVVGLAGPVLTPRRGSDLIPGYSAVDEPVVIASSASASR